MPKLLPSSPGPCAGLVDPGSSPSNTPPITSGGGCPGCVRQSCRNLLASPLVCGYVRRLTNSWQKSICASPSNASRNCSTQSRTAAEMLGLSLRATANWNGRAVDDWCAVGDFSRATPSTLVACVTPPGVLCKPRADPKATRSWNARPPRNRSSWCICAAKRGLLPAALVTARPRLRPRTRPAHSTP